MYESRIPLARFFEMNGSQLMAILSIQRLRGDLEHFQSVDAVWKPPNGPSEALLGRPGEQGRYVRCPNPAVWNLFLGVYGDN